MKGLKSPVGAREAAWLMLAVGYGLMLWQDLPGHMSVDSVIELHEGRFHVRETWGPAFFPWLLGVFDAIWPGTVLYVIVSALLLYGGWASLPLLRRRASWWLVPLAAGAVVTPDILIYQGIVWHDVLFADAAVAGFLCLAFAARDWTGPRRPWIRLGAGLLLLAAASLIRQNGLVVLPVAALAVGWTARGGGWRRALAWAFGWGATAAAVTAALSVLCLPQGPGFEKANVQGFRTLAVYDLAGGLARDPKLSLAHMERADPTLARIFREQAPRFYSPQRIDFLDSAPHLTKRLPGLPSAALMGDWKNLILHRPDIYWPMRFEVFRWVFATPVIDACLPVNLGVDGPPEQMRDLHLAKLWDDHDDRLFNYATWFYDTPAMSHVAYAVLALALIGLLLWRRDPADGPMIALLASALAFAASFFPISLACDYRYIYFLDVAALTGLLYFAADPRLRPRASGA